jgi:uncharacterized membrane protein YdbT with pleckstrin-like domain
MKKISDDVIWQDRKRTLFGLPWSFTRYFITSEKVLIDVGLLSRTEEEIRLYRITDVTLKRSLGERIFGLGTIHCCSGDKSTPEFDIKHIKKPRETKEMLSNLVEAERNERRIGLREFLDSESDTIDND